jgi:DNA polymerase-3 subunit chi
MIPEVKLFFLKVEDVESKLGKICSTVKNHFNQRDKILITVPDEASATYVDQLLWRLPPESFIPHVIAAQPINEAVVITTGLRNLNQATILINLCPNPSSILQHFQTVYELMDMTAPIKTTLSQQRYETYKKAGYSITII